jgi:hypothetical protein
LMIEEPAGRRSDMGYSVLRPSWGLRCPARPVKITELSYVPVENSCS